MSVLVATSPILHSWGCQPTWQIIIYRLIESKSITPIIFKPVRTIWYNSLRADRITSRSTLSWSPPGPSSGGWHCPWSGRRRWWSSLLSGWIPPTPSTGSWPSLSWYTGYTYLVQQLFILYSCYLQVLSKYNNAKKNTSRPPPTMYLSANMQWRMIQLF